VAEVDGNRTRRTGIARPTRFEGGGAHQVLGHLRRPTYRSPSPEHRRQQTRRRFPRLAPMKKLLLLLVVVVLGVVVAKKLQET
jgi:hypothetical protein